MSGEAIRPPVLPRVALYGTFDVLNYGDLLFPHLVAHALDPSLHECVAVSPTRATLAWDDTVPTQAVEDAPGLDARLHLIGGGNIIHARETPLQAYAATPFGRSGAYASLWLGAGLIAAQSGARLAWNAPGVPAAIAGDVLVALRDLVLAASDYVSLRDAASAGFLGIDPTQLVVVPDTALDIARLWPAATLRQHARRAFERHGMAMPPVWLVFHLNNRYLDGEPDETARIIAAIAEEQGALPVLVAIGPCHGDDALARQIGAGLRTSALVVDRPAGLKEIAGLIAHGNGYVGSSLHGLITALSYGCPAMAVARPHMVKFQGFLSQLGMTTRFFAAWGDARRAAPRLLQPLSRVDIAAIARAQDQLGAHWGRLRGLLGGGATLRGASGRARLLQWMSEREGGPKDWRCFTRALVRAPAAEPADSSSSTPCNICGQTERRPGPLSQSDVVGSGAICAGCGASARHRAMRVVLDVLRRRGAPGQTCFRFGRDRVLAGGWFAALRHCDAAAAAPEDDLPKDQADVVACIDSLERAPDVQRLLRAMLCAAHADGFVILALRNVPGCAHTLDWGFARGDREGEFRRFGEDVEATLRAALPDAAILVADPADPVTGLRTRVFLAAHSADALLPLRRSAVLVRLLAADGGERTTIDDAARAAPAAQTPRSDDGPAAEAAALRALLATAGASSEPPTGPSPGVSDLAERIGKARARWPNDLGLALVEGSWLERMGRAEDAEACYRAAASSHAANPWPHVRLVELKLRQRQGASAAAIFAEHVWPGGAPEATRTGLLSRITLTHADNEARHAFLSGLLRNVPDDRFVLLKLAAMRFRARDREAAEQLFAAARALGELPVESQLLELELHLVAMRFEEAYALATALHARVPDRLDFARRAIQSAHFCGRMSEMLALLAAALRRWPRDWLLLFRYNRCTIPFASDRALYDLLAGQLEASAGDERWLFQFAVASLRHGETARAMAIIDAVTPTGPVAGMASPLRAALHAHPMPIWDNARGISNDPAEDVQVVRTADATATVVLLAGVQGGLGYLPFAMADGLLAQRPVNVVYLRDLNNRGFTCGVQRFGPDQAAMISGLGELCHTLGAPVVTMGASLGGVAAIRTAALMHAHAAISFAGGIHLGADATDDEAPAAAGGTRASLFSGFTQAERSIVALIRTAPRTRIHQCFGADYAPDVESAELLRDVPNAVLHPQPGCADHFAIEHMIAGPGFFAVLDEAIAMPPPGAP